jgi:hypothetical protein
MSVFWALCGSLLGIVLNIVLNIVSEELRDRAPDAAYKLVHWLAYRCFADETEQPERRALEFKAEIDQRRGTMKLLRAIHIAAVVALRAPAKAGRVRVKAIVRRGEILGQAVRTRGAAVVMVITARSVTAFRGIRSLVLSGRRIATAEVMTVALWTFRTVLIALFFVTEALGQLLGAGLVHMT